jgi:hypothetical protein
MTHRYCNNIFTTYFTIYCRRMYHVWGKREVHTGFWWGDLREGDHGRPRRRWEDNIKMDLQEVGWGHGLD